MNEIIAGIQVIKMYTWEKPFAHLVSLARRYQSNYFAFSTTVNNLELLDSRLIILSILRTSEDFSCLSS